MKPTLWKKSKASKPQMQTILTMDDIDFIIIVVLDTSEDILQCNEAKQETMYERIEADLKGVQQALHSSRVVSTIVRRNRVGRRTYQLCLHCVQEEKEKVIEALKQEKEEAREQNQVAQ
jgi:hypothetical protein